MRKILLAAALVAGMLAASAPAGATCTPGRVGIDRETGRPYVELPRCQPPPR